MRSVGRTLWAIPGGRVPEDSTGREPENTSNDTFCVLNAGPREARIEAVFYFSDAEPVGPFRFSVAARRVRHVRVNDLIDPQALPLGVDYGCLVWSDVPVVVQFSRKDTSRAENGLASTMAFPVE